jgi:hypothetical protein
MVLLLVCLLILAIILLCLINQKIVLGIWSIKVFKSQNMITKSPDKGHLVKPSLSATDVKDVTAEFIADPFIVHHNSLFYLFFEILDKASGKGIIGLAVSKDGDNWDYDQVVLKEDYHLSYPHIFKFKEDFYMIPETSEASKVLLYKANNFPYEWEVVSELLNGKYVDSSIFRYENKWWMFAAKSGHLHLFYSHELDKEWTEHPNSPLISNNYSITRPGGRVVVEEGCIFRYTQDGKPNYGSAVRAFKITKLTEIEYQEEEVSVILSGSREANNWNRDGMHSIDQLKLGEDKWLVAVDGHKLETKRYVLWKINRLSAKLFYGNKYN